jgi:hypothetical protein
MKYDFELLDKYCKENNVILLEDYSSYKLNRDIYVKGNCCYNNCSNTFEKKFRELINAGGYCTVCIQIVRNNKRKQNNLNNYGIEEPTKLYTIQKLNEICINDNITLIKNYSDKIYGESIIEGICVKCNTNIFKRTLKDIIKNKNFYCLKCKYENANIIRENTNIKKYGVKIISQNKEIQEKIKNNCMIKYGVQHTGQLETVKNKFKQTCIDKYGVENPSQDIVVKNKKIETYLKNWGVEHPSKLLEIKKTKEETSLKKWGTKHPSQNSDIKNKMKNTCLIKYGCEYPMQYSPIFNKQVKSSYLKKEYIFPSGKSIYIQGYEHLALDELILNNDIDETEIIVGISNVPEIWYFDSCNKKHRHYVDIFIPKFNKCIEVKSTWTAKKNEDNIFLKQIAAKELGYNYEIWVYDEKYNKICYK